MTPLDEFDFWTNVANRRNVYFYVWIGWLVVGPALFFFFSFLFGDGQEGLASIAALLTWGWVWFRAGQRVAEIRCLRCNERAFQHPIFFMKDAECVNCGYSKSETSYRSGRD